MIDTLTLNDLTADVLKAHAKSLLETLYISGNTPDNCETFTNILNKARELDTMNSEQDTEKFILSLSKDVAAEFKSAELWELPKQFNKRDIACNFPISCLPDVLKNYLQAVCIRNKTRYEMAVLPMFSALSLCLQGKAKIQSVETSDYSEHLNLYTLTVAEPSTRKSSSLSVFTKPIEEYQRDYNERNKLQIEKTKAKREYLEQQRRTAKMKKNAENDIMRITTELYELEELHELTLTMSDTTPEALAVEMQKQAGRMGILSSEAGTFDTISGLYTNGKSNIDLFLNAYDGSFVNVSRITRTVKLDVPLLTMGLMTQPEHFQKSVIHNGICQGRGFIPRFLISFPDRAFELEKKLEAPPVPPEIQQSYDELIKRLLSLPYSKLLPVIKHSKESKTIFGDYYYSIIDKLHNTACNDLEKEFLGKQLGKALRIAGILHLCEHSAAEPLSGETALAAVSISMWAEDERRKGFGEEYSDTPEEKNAKYILNRIKHTYTKEAMDKPGIPIATTYRELIWLCRSIHDSADLENAVDLLEDMKYLTVEEVKKNGKGRPKKQVIINPVIFM